MDTVQVLCTLTARHSAQLAHCSWVGRRACWAGLQCAVHTNQRALAVATHHTRLSRHTKRDTFATTILIVPWRQRRQPILRKHQATTMLLAKLRRRMVLQLRPR